MKMYPHTFSGEKAVQLEAEFAPFLEVVRRENVTSFLEVGCGRGDSFHEICLQMPKGSRAVAIDLPNNGWGFEDGGYLLASALEDLENKGYEIGASFSDSRGQQSINFSKDAGPFDLILIDGDHTYEGVKADWENYGHLGRIVAFHDIADPGLPNDKGEVIEVKKFWDEIKGDYHHVEFIDNKAQFPMGIGVLFRA